MSNVSTVVTRYLNRWEKTNIGYNERLTDDVGIVDDSCQLASGVREKDIRIGKMHKLLIHVHVA